MVGGNQPHLRCKPCKTCRYVMTLRRVFTTLRALLACAVFTGAIYTFVHIPQPPLTDLIKRPTLGGGPTRRRPIFRKNKISSTNCWGVFRPKNEMILITYSCDVGGAGLLYQWQEQNAAKLSHCQYHTSSLNHDGSSKHDYPANECRPVPLRHWN